MGEDPTFRQCKTTCTKLLPTTENSLTGSSRRILRFSAGNETTIGSATYTYLPRNFLATGDGLTYTYDGFGRRTVTQGSPGIRYSFYDPSFTMLSESALVSSGKPGVKYDYIWLGGSPVAQIDNTGTHYTFNDHLEAPAGLWDPDYVLPDSAFNGNNRGTLPCACRH